MLIEGDVEEGSEGVGVGEALAAGGFGGGFEAEGWVCKSAVVGVLGVEGGEGDSVGGEG